ncbi:MAG: hypothetical protein H8E89_00755 [Candidatus Nitrosopelagicus sp.]|nr:hypothetical protein [Candidatus Nitrosopelagicus sp.]
MVKIEHSFELDCDEKKLLKILTDYNNLSSYLPRKLQNLEILEEYDNFVTINVTILLRTLIKKEFSQKIKIEKKSENDLSLEILDGFAKGTDILISISKQKEKTLCKVNSDVKLSLKTVILLPIIKREYNSFVSSIFRKISKDTK